MEFRRFIKNTKILAILTYTLILLITACQADPAQIVTITPSATEPQQETPVLSVDPTATSTSVLVPTIVKATPTQPLPSPQPSNTPTATLLPKSTATATATSTSVPKPTAIPIPSVTPTPTSLPPLPTGTPDPFVPVTKAGSFSDKYGVIVHSSELNVVQSTLDTVDAEWFISFSPDVNNTPPGKSKPVFIRVGNNKPVLSTSELQTIASVVPGAVWYLGGEPNISHSVDDVIEDLHYYYTQIKIIDPSAKITSPSILNWDFTCIGCGGYTSGQNWMMSFVATYQDVYGALPPWDLWAIDVYPIDWKNLPNTGFLPETIQEYAPERPPDDQTILAVQIQGYRDFIDSLPGKSGQPIIVTEVGIHWGWSKIKFGVPGCNASPDGEYKPLVIRDYLNSAYNWLEGHAVSHNIERWFTFITYADIESCRSDGYAGMSLLDSPDEGASLTDLGNWYVARSAP
ncbi:hypothetical protein JYU04_04040 [Dehalococcoides mccartyi]|nr:hypothetical protein [Dehalococcoides mccartyi]